MIAVGMLAKIRRMYIREKLSIREIARRTNLSRNTVRQWLKSPEMGEPKYPERRIASDHRIDITLANISAKHFQKYYQLR